jgi:hypothetical protein
MIRIAYSTESWREKCLFCLCEWVYAEFSRSWNSNMCWLQDYRSLQPLKLLAASVEWHYICSFRLCRRSRDDVSMSCWTTCCTHWFRPVRCNGCPLSTAVVGWKPYCEFKWPIVRTKADVVSRKEVKRREGADRYWPRWLPLTLGIGYKNSCSFNLKNVFHNIIFNSFSLTTIQINCIYLRLFGCAIHRA